MIWVGIGILPLLTSLEFLIVGFSAESMHSLSSPFPVLWWDSPFYWSSFMGGMLDLNSLPSCLSLTMGNMYSDCFINWDLQRMKGRKNLSSHLWKALKITNHFFFPWQYLILKTLVLFGHVSSMSQQKQFWTQWPFSRYSTVKLRMSSWIKTKALGRRDYSHL